MHALECVMSCLKVPFGGSKQYSYILDSYFTTSLDYQDFAKYHLQRIL